MAHTCAVVAYTCAVVLHTRLAARSLALGRGERWLFRDLSFDVAPGEALVLRGANGVGKTSLLRVLAGLVTPDAGEFLLNEQPCPPLSVRHRDAMLYVGHANALKDDFSAAENLADQLALDAIHATRESQLDALRQVGLLTRRQVAARKLSQGQKRRIGMARLLLGERPVWLLDEPTNALDDGGVALFVEMVDAHLAKGGVAVIATHLTLPLRTPVRELLMQEILQ